MLETVSADKMGQVGRRTKKEKGADRTQIAFSRKISFDKEKIIEGRYPVTVVEGKDWGSLDFPVGKADTKVRVRGKRKMEVGERELILKSKSISTHGTKLLCGDHCGMSDSECSRAVCECVCGDGALKRVW